MSLIKSVVVKKSRRTTSPHHFKVTPHVRLAIFTFRDSTKSCCDKTKRPVLTHTDHWKHQKANGTCSLKKVISVPFMYKKYESKDLVTLVLSV